MPLLRNESGDATEENAKDASVCGVDDEDDGPLSDFPLMPSSTSTPSVPPGLSDEEVGGAYVTVSQRAAAQERAERAAQS